MSDDIRAIQQQLADFGWPVGAVDGVWGQHSQEALSAALRAAHGLSTASPLAWGQKVSAVFRDKVRAICAELGFDPNLLMACMAWESAETFSPSVLNAAGSGAVGLIQFMPSTAAALGTTVEALAALTAEAQLDYVRRYFLPWKGRVSTLSDCYMVILFPSAVGKSEDYVLFDKADPDHPARYIQNAGLDFNRNGQITKAEAAARVQQRLDEGRALAA